MGRYDCSAYRRPGGKFYYYDDRERSYAGGRGCEEKTVRSGVGGSETDTGRTGNRKWHDPGKRDAGTSAFLDREDYSDEAVKRLFTEDAEMEFAVGGTDSIFTV